MKQANRVDCFPCIRAPARIALPETQFPWNAIGRVGRFIRLRYAPLILRPVVKGIVLLIFAGVFVLSVISIQHMRLGLGAFLYYDPTPYVNILPRSKAGITIRVLPHPVL
jgi:Niemann-Pick C1 protein